MNTIKDKINQSTQEKWLYQLLDKHNIDLNQTLTFKVSHKARAINISEIVGFILIQPRNVRRQISVHLMVLDFKGEDIMICLKFLAKLILKGGK